MDVQYAAVDSATAACVQLWCDAGSSCPNLLQHNYPFRIVQQELLYQDAGHCGVSMSKCAEHGVIRPLHDCRHNVME